MNRVNRFVRGRYVLPAALAVSYVGVIGNVFFPVVRFLAPPLNPLFVTAAGVLPWVALVLVIKQGHKWAATILVMVLLPLLVSSLCLSPFALLTTLDRALRPGTPDYETLDRIDLSGYWVVVHRTNFAGAVSPYGIEIRQERKILPGVVLVRRLEYYNPAAEVNVAVIREHTVRVTIPPYGRIRPTASTETFTLKPYVYF